ncbi:hypothetical protein I8J29_10685 [Paenibacillus sp. MWE-103]|uniref:Uncharacterized protein n=1 Tax=Paenibacillus artemisiicola TaxID=1172618 RepID=A0ABS3W8M4_9BACL|nr:MULTISPECIES: hypothetical protein [Paenibacillus]MBO7744665.1 hypothetical protein [Paenibacillus artemisiicola]SFJ01623.1 hypothetical protein SAMN02799624_03010 [Paenibacillus sp. UNC496MF]
MNEALLLITERLENRQSLQALMPKRVWDAALDERIAELPLALSTAPQADRPALIALKAGLHLLNESLGASHAYAQEIEDDATGCYWHGIMHRMEGDFSNANYWFRMAGAHPAMQRLQDRAADWVRNGTVLSDVPEGAIRDGLAEIARRTRWNASAFTGLVQLQESGRSAEDARGALEYVQHLELAELFAHTWQAAKHALG